MSMLPMEYTVRPGSVAGDAYIGVVIRAPFCPLCAASARRRLPTRVEAMALGLLCALLLCFFTAQAVAEVGGLSPAPFLAAAAVIGLLLPFVLPRLIRPDRLQSSFWRPVEVDVTLRKNVLEVLSFKFASKPYPMAFVAANADGIRDGGVVVRGLR